MEFDPDDELLWVWCGDEGTAKLIGPFFTDAQAQDDIERAGNLCGHDHMTMRSTLRQMAARLPRFVLIVPAIDDREAFDILAENGRTIASYSTTFQDSARGLRVLADLHREMQCVS